MSKRTAPNLPGTERLLQEFGERLRLARLRRRLQAKQVAERAGMTVTTLRSLERGKPGVTLGAYAAVLQTLGLERDLALVAKDDPVGRSLQDHARDKALRPRRARKTTKTLPHRPSRPGRVLKEDDYDGPGVEHRADYGVIRAEDLAGLLVKSGKPSIAD